MIPTKCNKLKFWIFFFFWLAAFLFVSQPALAEEAMDDNWKFSIAGYLWGATIGGESATGGDIDIDFSDLIDNMNIGAMGTVGAYKGKWSFLVDAIYLDVEDDDNVALDRLLELSDVELKGWIVTPMVAYNVLHSDRWRLDLLAGARYLWLEVDLEFMTRPPFQPRTSRSSDSGSAWNGIVGARGKINLNPEWYLPFQFDIGSGDTNLTWQVYGGVGYKFDKFDMVLAYRYLDWDFDDDDKGGGTFNDLNISGPMFGFKYLF